MDQMASVRFFSWRPVKVELKEEIKDGGPCCLSVTTTKTTITRIEKCLQTLSNELQIYNKAVVSTPCRSLKVPGSCRDPPGTSRNNRDPRNQGSCRYNTKHPLV